MDVRIEKLNPVEMRLYFKVLAAEVVPQFQVKMATMQNSGKDSTNLKHVHLKKAKDDFLNQLMSAKLSQVLPSTALKPVSKVRYQNKRWDGISDLEFTAQFEITPDLSFVKIENHVDKSKLDVAPPTENEVDRVVQTLLKSKQQFEEIKENRSAKEGDVVILEIKAFQNGKISKNDSSDGLHIQIRKDVEKSALEKNAMGLKVGDTRGFDFQFPSNFANPVLANSEMHFDIKLLKILGTKDAVLTDQMVPSFFIQGISGQEKYGKYPKNKADLLALIHKELFFTSQMKAFHHLKTELFEKLLQKNNFVPPKYLVQTQVSSLAQAEKQRWLQMQSDKKWTAELEQKFQKYIFQEKLNLEAQAKKRVCIALIVDHIAKQLKITCDEKDYEDYFMEQHRMTGEARQYMRERMKNPQYAHFIRYAIIENKVARTLFDWKAPQNSPHNQVA